MISWDWVEGYFTAAKNLPRYAETLSDNTDTYIALVSTLGSVGAAIMAAVAATKASRIAEDNHWSSLSAEMANITRTSNELHMEVHSKMPSASKALHHLKRADGSGPPFQEKIQK